MNKVSDLVELCEGYGEFWGMTTIHHIPTKISSGVFHHGSSLGPLRHVCTQKLETRTSKLVFLGKSQIIRMLCIHYLFLL